MDIFLLNIYAVSIVNCIEVKRSLSKSTLNDMIDNDIDAIFQFYTQFASNHVAQRRVRMIVCSVETAKGTN